MNKASPAGTRFGGASKLGKERTGSASADMNGRKSVLTHSMPVFRRRPITESSGSRELARVDFWGGKVVVWSFGRRVSMVRGGQPAVRQWGGRPKAVNCKYCRGVDIR